ncbi:ras guanine nucleotide exchange factor domain-containing protein [Pilobolus umbonatus]|nr:ras guanine nucleotide exchange factor domain-containing protein [Pilobolus umbonatus]
METLYQTPNDHYTTANTLLEEGKIKDAYSAFLSVVELTTQQLYKVKFVHQTIVSKPSHYEDSVALLRSSLEQLEKIATHSLPGAQTTPKSKSPPPVPPKPTLQKPAIPPKPRQLPPIDTQQKTKRGRGGSVSFANPSLVDDDDDDEEIEIHFNPDKHGTLSQLKRPYTFFSENRDMRTQSCMIDTKSRERNSMDVILESVINPSNLVPAQTNTGDSLALNSLVTDYVPSIPAPPLLATHRSLQSRLTHLEKDLEECRKPNPPIDTMERSQRVMTARDALNKVRTLYMSAMTVPDILQFSPHLTAYQLTLIESAIFRDIPREALLCHSARTPHPKIVASTDFFNYVTRAIEHSILLPQEASRRAEIMNRWIKIATYLLLLNNYQTLKAVISALGTPPIKRLRRTWDCIPRKRMGRLDLMILLMSESDNYSRYRACVVLDKKKVWHQPVVPFLGVFIHDITYLNAAMKGKTDTRVQSVLNSVNQFQSAPAYPHRPPSSYLSSGNKKKQFFRPINALPFNKGRGSSDLTEIELQQQLIMQYLLMRPWVSEKIMDALSSLREPAKSRSVTSPTTLRTEIDSHGSILSSATNSFMKFGGSTSVLPLDEVASTEDNKKTLSGFWPFRKSTDASNRTSLNTESLPDQSWSEDDDEEEAESPPSEGGIEFPLDQKQKNGHNRSLSLPSHPMIMDGLL